MARLMHGVRKAVLAEMAITMGTNFLLGTRNLMILQFCTTFRKGGGIQTHVSDLSHWLEKNGHNIQFAGDPIDSSMAANSQGFISLPMTKIANADRNIITRIGTMVKSAFRLRRAISKHPVDIIHTHETAPALVARLATFGKKIPIVMTFHGSAPERIPSAARTAKYCADVVASPSRISLNALIANGVDSDKARVLGLGIKPLPEHTPEQVEDLRRRYLPGGKGTLIFSPSRLDHQKGIDVMIDVAKNVVAKHPDAVFVVAGGGPLTGVVDGWAEKAGLSSNMKFLGAIDTVPLHLQASDIFLLTSRWEALPISIVEAFRAARPVIATDCGGVSELVDDSVGALCPVEDVAALTQSVLDLIESESVRKSKGQAALKRSTEDRFDCEAVHAKFEETYKELVGGR